jgi:hypothetical protein
VKGLKRLGVRLGNWLTPEQGQALWQAPDSRVLKGKRDRALLALLLACGLISHPRPLPYKPLPWQRAPIVWMVFSGFPFAAGIDSVCFLCSCAICTSQLGGTYPLPLRVSCHPNVFRIVRGLVRLLRAERLAILRGLKITGLLRPLRPAR